MKLWLFLEDNTVTRRTIHTQLDERQFLLYVDKKLVERSAQFVILPKIVHIHAPHQTTISWLNVIYELVECTHQDKHESHVGNVYYELSCGVFRKGNISQSLK